MLILCFIWKLNDLLPNNHQLLSVIRRIKVRQWKYPEVENYKSCELDIFIKKYTATVGHSSRIVGRDIWG